MVHLSKQLDPVASGWPGCLRAIAATALLVEEATKLTMDQPLEVLTPQQVQGVLEIKGQQWLTGGRLTKYQAILLDSPEVTLKVCQALNPATCMPRESPGELSHSCTETIKQVYSSRPDLRDQPLEDPDADWFTDGSSYIHDGIQIAGYAIVDLHELIEADALPPQTLAPEAKLIALARALRLGKDKRINIYRDSKYAFLVLHAHAAFLKHRGLLTAWGSPIQHCQEILELLEAVQGNGTYPL